VYATDLKRDLAGVPGSLLAERGPVDPDVALALADGARRACAADWGVATTGVAGPDPQPAARYAGSSSKATARRSGPAPWRPRWRCSARRWAAGDRPVLTGR
jgi:nicotinamide mononucleotide (NMN) deamidase PncC